MYCSSSVSLPVQPTLTFLSVSPEPRPENGQCRKDRAVAGRSVLWNNRVGWWETDKREGKQLKKIVANSVMEGMTLYAAFTIQKSVPSSFHNPKTSAQCASSTSKIFNT
jgi:hypothetical protein